MILNIGLVRINNTGNSPRAIYKASVRVRKTSETEKFQQFTKRTSLRALETVKY